MNEPDLEQQLRAARLAAPSDQLDRRIDELLAAPARLDREPGHPVILPWLALPVGVAAAFLIFYSTVQYSPRQPPPLVYQVEPQGLLRASLLAPPVESQTPPAMIVTVQSLPSTPP